MIFADKVKPLKFKFIQLKFIEIHYKSEDYHRVSIGLFSKNGKKTNSDLHKYH